jgi:hypothetical protein
MKKYLFWAAVSIGAFSLGLAAFALYYLSIIPEVPIPELLTVQKKSGCAKLKSFPGLSKQISELKKGKSDYFPQKIWGNDMSPKHSQAGWYGKHLEAMNEKSLLDSSRESAETYRFLWLRTFHHPIFVRVECARTEVKLFTKELDGLGGYAPGKISRSGEGVLTESEWCEFLRLLDKADFWKMPSENDVLGNDGAQWVLEGVKENRYHVVDRWTPRDESKYRAACIYLLKLSGVDVDKLKDDLY